MQITLTDLRGLEIYCSQVQRIYKIEKQPITRIQSTLCNERFAFTTGVLFGENYLLRENCLYVAKPFLCPFFSGERAAAQTVPECVQSPYGCCWDFTAATGPNGAGCRGKNKSSTLQTVFYVVDQF